MQHNFHTREMSRLGGLLLQAPKMGWILGFCVMASLGLPGLAGFWGEFPAILVGVPTRPTALSEPVFRTFMVVAAVGTVFAAGYLLWMLQRVAFGHVRDEFADAHIHDVNVAEWIAWTPMLLLILVLGVFPEPALQGHRRRRAPHDRRHREGDRGMIDVNPTIDWHALAPDIVLVGDDPRGARRRPAPARTAAPGRRRGSRRSACLVR